MEKSGNFEGRDLTNNILMKHVRKTVSTTSLAEGNEHTKEIATVMAHSLKKANEFPKYLINAA